MFFITWKLNCERLNIICHLIPHFKISNVYIYWIQCINFQNKTIVIHNPFNNLVRSSILNQVAHVLINEFLKDFLTTHTDRIEIFQILTYNNILMYLTSSHYWLKSVDFVMFSSKFFKLYICMNQKKKAINFYH